ncbi:flavin reductase family protein [Nocardioides sp. cx-173]|uniref:flavin reductase family protein n=1 Tax=Nocardioides sp. cx-173 TaxID=2898796 RepID=UPI001E3BBFC7|nr:flavin reductase family protein [Nocardioides sp. cx-173]MCD4524025.1 flavin reductase family protein [Nocardioides sp. cx-173]UGB41426.1 flavin reductase family protein [Nocardioides sp. cx-173]
MTTDDRLEVELVHRVDADELRRTIARVPAPVTIVAAHTSDGPVGFTASSFVNISVEPPLVGVLVGATSRSYDHFLRADRVAINLLADHHSEAAVVFAGKGDDKFDHVDLDPDFPAAPVIIDAMGVLVGRVAQRPVLGDHLLLVVHVEQVARRVKAPLVYQDRKFRALADLQL